jgi:hypothetical protein
MNYCGGVVVGRNSRLNATHLLEHFYFGAEALDGLVVLAFEVICETCGWIGSCGV